jgi:hypothetical protein
MHYRKLEQRNKLFTIKVTLIVLSSSLVFMSLTIESAQHQAFARCPNGTHKSPSGDCETVVPHPPLPRCPNGSHRSPSGDCEKVTDTTSDSFTDTKKTDKKASDADNNTSSSTDEHSTKKSNHSKSHHSSSTSVSTDTSISPATTSNSIQSFPSSISLQPGQCDITAWNHVYNLSKLQIIYTCKNISGVIESINSQINGNFYIRLKVDQEFSNLIPSANINGQFGDLIVEPVCEKAIMQANTMPTCQDFNQNVTTIPPVGTHVKVTGAYVLDNEQGGLAKIHPVTSIVQDR